MDENNLNAVDSANGNEAINELLGTTKELEEDADQILSLKKCIDNEVNGGSTNKNKEIGDLLSTTKQQDGDINPRSVLEKSVDNEVADDSRINNKEIGDLLSNTKEIKEVVDPSSSLEKSVGNKVTDDSTNKNKDIGDLLSTSKAMESDIDQSSSLVTSVDNEVTDESTFLAPTPMVQKKNETKTSSNTVPRWDVQEWVNSLGSQENNVKMENLENKSITSSEIEEDKNTDTPSITKSDISGVNPLEHSHDSLLDEPLQLSSSESSVANANDELSTNFDESIEIPETERTLNIDENIIHNSVKSAETLSNQSETIQNEKITEEGGENIEDIGADVENAKMLPKQSIDSPANELISNEYNELCEIGNQPLIKTQSSITEELENKTDIINEETVVVEIGEKSINATDLEVNKLDISDTVKEKIKFDVIQDEIKHEENYSNIILTQNIFDLEDSLDDNDISKSKSNDSNAAENEKNFEDEGVQNNEKSFGEMTEKDDLLVENNLTNKEQSESQICNESKIEVNNSGNNVLVEEEITTECSNLECDPSDQEELQQKESNDGSISNSKNDNKTDEEQTDNLVENSLTKTTNESVQKQNIDDLNKSNEIDIKLEWHIVEENLRVSNNVNPRGDEPTIAESCEKETEEQEKYQNIDSEHEDVVNAKHETELENEFTKGSNKTNANCNLCSPSENIEKESDPENDKANVSIENTVLLVSETEEKIKVLVQDFDKNFQTNSPVITDMENAEEVDRKITHNEDVLHITDSTQASKVIENITTLKTCSSENFESEQSNIQKVGSNKSEKNTYTSVSSLNVNMNDLNNSYIVTYITVSVKGNSYETPDKSINSKHQENTEESSGKHKEYLEKTFDIKDEKDVSVKKSDGVDIVHLINIEEDKEPNSEINQNTKDEIRDKETEEMANMVSKEVKKASSKQRRAQSQEIKCDKKTDKKRAGSEDLAVQQPTRARRQKIAEVKRTIKEESNQINETFAVEENKNDNANAIVSTSRDRVRKPVAVVEKFLESARMRATTPKRLHRITATSTPQYLKSESIDPLGSIMANDESVVKHEGVENSPVQKNYFCEEVTPTTTDKTVDNKEKQDSEWPTEDIRENKIKDEQKVKTTTTRSRRAKVAKKDDQMNDEDLTKLPVDEMIESAEQTNTTKSTTRPQRARRQPKTKVEANEEKMVANVGEENLALKESARKELGRSRGKKKQNETLDRLQETRVIDTENEEVVTKASGTKSVRGKTRTANKQADQHNITEIAPVNKDEDTTMVKKASSRSTRANSVIEDGEKSKVAAKVETRTKRGKGNKQHEETYELFSVEEIPEDPVKKPQRGKARTASKQPVEPQECETPGKKTATRNKRTKSVVEEDEIIVPEEQVQEVKLSRGRGRAASKQPVETQQSETQNDSTVKKVSSRTKRTKSAVEEDVSVAQKEPEQETKLQRGRPRVANKQPTESRDFETDVSTSIKPASRSKRTKPVVEEIKIIPQTVAEQETKPQRGKRVAAKKVTEQSEDVNVKRGARKREQSAIPAESEVEEKKHKIENSPTIKSQKTRSRTAKKQAKDEDIVEETKKEENRHSVIDEEIEEEEEEEADKLQVTKQPRSKGKLIKKESEVSAEPSIIENIPKNTRNLRGRYGKKEEEIANVTNEETTEAELSKSRSKRGAKRQATEDDTENPKKQVRNVRIDKKQSNITEQTECVPAKRVTRARH